MTLHQREQHDEFRIGLFYMVHAESFFTTALKDLIKINIFFKNHKK